MTSRVPQLIADVQANIGLNDRFPEGTEGRWPASHVLDQNLVHEELVDMAGPESRISTAEPSFDSSYATLPNGRDELELLVPDYEPDVRGEIHSVGFAEHVDGAAEFAHAEELAGLESLDRLGFYFPFHFL